MKKLDPHDSEGKYKRWKDKGAKFKGLSSSNQKVLQDFIFDMEKGKNVNAGTKKGARSFLRLNTLRSRMTLICSLLQERGINNVTTTNEDNILDLFHDMRSGSVISQHGRKYKSVADYEKVFKSFWNWHIKVSKKKGKVVPNICEDVGGVRKDEPTFVYYSEEDFRKLVNKAQYNYRVLLWFLYDTGIRPPSELMNIKVSDISSDFKELNIRGEISKTFGRRIKLMLCSDELKRFVQDKKLKGGDYVFDIYPKTVNEYLKRLAKRVFGDKMSKGGKAFKDTTMYDFRHSSCCYWLPRYKSESGLKFRFGWKKGEMIHYYSKLLGMRDTITQEDLLLDTTKTELENQNKMLEEQNKITQERMRALEKRFEELAKSYASGLQQ